jgi:hypothetical protein
VDVTEGKASIAGRAGPENLGAVRTVLHLVRPDRIPLAVAEHDWVVYLAPIRLVQGTALYPLGALDHDQVVALAFAADLVVTW